MIVLSGGRSRRSNEPEASVPCANAKRRPQAPCIIVQIQLWEGVRKEINRHIGES